MASVVPDLQLPSQPQSVTVWYIVGGSAQGCEQLAESLYAAVFQTRDHLVTSLMPSLLCRYRAHGKSQGNLVIAATKQSLLSLILQLQSR